MQQIPITELFDLLERYNGMTPMKVAGEAPIAPDPLNSDDPLVRAAAEDLAAKSKSCASRAA
ncbi:MAG TPA: hypothetical protein VG889_22540 [Rhizomicrobium sp.]|nr:hypothetical protein [Rhizomicrobium sp.]